MSTQPFEFFLGQDLKKVVQKDELLKRVQTHWNTIKQHFYSKGGEAPETYKKLIPILNEIHENNNDFLKKSEFNDLIDNGTIPETSSTTSSEGDEEERKRKEEEERKRKEEEERKRKEEEEAKKKKPWWEIAGVPQIMRGVTMALALPTMELAANEGYYKQDSYTRAGVNKMGYWQSDRLHSKPFTNNILQQSGIKNTKTGFEETVSLLTNDKNIESILPYIEDVTQPNWETAFYATEIFRKMGHYSPEIVQRILDTYNAELLSKEDFLEAEKITQIIQIVNKEFKLKKSNTDNIHTVLKAKDGSAQIVTLKDNIYTTESGKAIITRKDIKSLLLEKQLLPSNFTWEDYYSISLVKEFKYLFENKILKYKDLNDILLPEEIEISPSVESKYNKHFNIETMKFMDHTDIKLSTEAGTIDLYNKFDQTKLKDFKAKTLDDAKSFIDNYKSLEGNTFLKVRQKNQFNANWPDMENAYNDMKEVQGLTKDLSSKTLAELDIISNNLEQYQDLKTVYTIAIDKVNDKKKALQEEANEKKAKNQFEEIKTNNKFTDKQKLIKVGDLQITNPDLKKDVDDYMLILNYNIIEDAIFTWYKDEKSTSTLEDVLKNLATNNKNLNMEEFGISTDFQTKINKYVGDILITDIYSVDWITEKNNQLKTKFND